MKTWLHNHRIRKSISEALLPLQRHDSVDVDDDRLQRPLPNTPLRIDSAGRIVESPSVDRMSIERYLSAPLEDEPASVPAIDRALKKHSPRDHAMHSPSSNRKAHSRDSSYDANSEGHRTCYTSGSAPASTGVPEVPKVAGLNLTRAATRSPERPMTSRTVDTEKSWAPQVDMRVTDEMAYAKMAQKPKLAWILGGDLTDAQSIKRPKSSAASMVTTSPTDDIPGLPSTSWFHEGDQDKAPRRAKSSDALDNKARKAAGQKPQPAPSLPSKAIKRIRFYCTFCQKRFQSQTEWMKHEQTIHMPAELWVCCPRTGDFPRRCPFCAKKDPSPSHLADHNYLTCQSKPLSERTFSQQDYFLQHVNQEHKVSPDQKPLRLSELLEAWRHPLPVKFGHQALHCGFCGQLFSTYRERTDHVAAHFIAGLDMMSWWPGRISHEIVDRNDTPSNPGQPQKCGYCERIYDSLSTAQKLHPVCTMWSCSFLPGMQHTIYPAGVVEDLEAVCCYCNESLVRGTGRVKGAVLKDHIAQHNFRNCSQRLYFSGQRFRQHLQDSHRTNNDATLFAGWTLLVKTCKKTLPSVFDPIDATPTALRRALTDPSNTTTSTTTFPARKKEKHDSKPLPPLPPPPKLNFMDLTPSTPLPSPPLPPPRKLRRKSSIHTVRSSIDAELSRPSLSIFSSRAASIDVVRHNIPPSHPPSMPPPPPPPPPPPVQQLPTHNPNQQQQQQQHRDTKSHFPTTSPPVDAAHTCPRFYRKKMDASMRNRLFVREEADGPLGKGLAKGYRKVPGGLFGGLVLRSSLIAGAPVRLMNGVDVYGLH
ncbi:hypothetical protein DM02DRAFT_648154 [Periconia macrospinosa]|uniref:C2H2-type domain-containing protein n=1 Tax=Periconia macrospinosa TaxID=97972 RepID=A0A2V1EC30_9PLEO|nr:hypothetical protein DM02DRAFT_648154 [Periconia macrospinosa]